MARRRLLAVCLLAAAAAAMPASAASRHSRLMVSVTIVEHCIIDADALESAQGPNQDSRGFPLVACGGTARQGQHADGETASGLSSAPKTDGSPIGSVSDHAARRNDGVHRQLLSALTPRRRG